MYKTKILVFSSGTTTGGGSGFENLVKASRGDILHAEIIGIVSNHANGGVYEKANMLGIPFIHFAGPWTSEAYQKIAIESGVDFFALSGWLKLVKGLDPITKFNSRTVFNIHPGPLPRFGGAGMYGHHIHEAVMSAYNKGEITHTAICMHFVSDKYDRGPIFFNLNIKINDDDTPKSLATRVNMYEHRYQPEITNMVVNGLIKWDGVNPKSLEVPREYSVVRYE